MKPRERRTHPLISITIGVVIALGSSSAWAYKIYKPEIHETMTALAEACLERSDGAKVERCEFDLTTAMEAVDITASHRAVRWPDDPTDQLVNIGVIDFGLDMLLRCNDRFEAIGGDMSRSAELGLLCNSHFGDLQFLHAMASGPDESNEVTLDRLTDWTRFNFRVATGQIGTADGWCDYVGDASNGLDAIRKSLLNAVDQAWCEDRPKTLLGVQVGTTKGWTIATLYNLKCRKPVNPATCDETLGEAAGQKAKENAIGAILHMVQDSYSLSHAHRSNAVNTHTGDFPAEARCAPIHDFMDYLTQMQEDVPHADADQLPTIVCDEGSEIHDPVTASANVLRFVRMGSDTRDPKAVEDALIDYLRASVFVMADS